MAEFQDLNFLSELYSTQRTGSLMLRIAKFINHSGRLNEWQCQLATLSQSIDELRGDHISDA